jgi:hypothetical protein
VVTTELPGRLVTTIACRMRATGAGRAAAAEWPWPDATIEVRHSRTPGKVPIRASYRPTHPEPQAVNDPRVPRRLRTDLALDIVGKTIFNADVESEASEIRAVLEAGMGVFHRFLLPGAELLWHLPLAGPS